MRAIVVREHGGLDKLVLERRAEPLVGPGEVGVQVAACGVNHLDVWVRRGVPGHVFPLPLVPGNDVAGTVYAVGAGVEDVAVGAEVVVAPGTSCGVCALCSMGRDHHCRRYAILGEHRDGGYADKVVVPRANIFLKPANLSFVEVAALGVAHLTAWRMLVGRAELRPGETVLIQAAGSGVGSAAVQIARLLGARIVAVASSAAKLQAAQALGADHGIEAPRDDVVKKVRALTDGRGADVVFEHVGAATWDQSLRALAWQGRLVTCGATTGGQVDINLQHLFFKSQSILGSTMGSRGDFYEVLGHAAAGRLRPVVHGTRPLEAVGEVHALIESRQVFGKMVLVVGPGT